MLAVPRTHDIQSTELEIFKKPARARWLQLRKTCITSTELAPLAGTPTYGNTRWSIYKEKRGEYESTFEGNQRTKWGLLFEYPIAKGVGMELRCKVRRLPDFYRRGPLGASFDYEILDGPYTDWLLEIKNVDYMTFRDNWREEGGNVYAPEHIELQMQGQLEVSRRPGCIIGANVGGNDLKIGIHKRDEKLGNALTVMCAGFWYDIDHNREPDVVGEDASLVAQLYSKVDDSKVIQAGSVLEGKLREFASYNAAQKKAEGEKKRLKAEILLDIGDAKRVISTTGTLDAGYTKGSPPDHITSDMVGKEIGGRKGFRRFTFRASKGAKP